MNGFKRHHHLDRRAVRVGDDVARRIVRYAFWVHLTHHQGNVVVVTKVRGIVHHDTALSRCLRSKFGGNRAACREQADLGIAKIEFIQALNLHRLTVELQSLTCRALRRQERKLSHGKFTFLQDVDQSLAHCSGRPGYRHIDCFFSTHFLFRTCVNELKIFDDQLAHRPATNGVVLCITSDIGGSVTVCQDLGYRAINIVCSFRHVEAVTKQHPDR